MESLALQASDLQTQPALQTDSPYGRAIDVADGLRDRAVAIIKEGHNPQQVMQSAMGDLKAMGNMSGLIAIMQTGQFSPQQMVLAERLAVKIIAYCALSKK
ncbi:hypothetical protein [Aeromonas phage phiWae15]|nr:hypothetical protein [Aeromonas phage phiWae15]